MNYLHFFILKHFFNTINDLFHVYKLKANFYCVNKKFEVPTLPYHMLVTGYNFNVFLQVFNVWFA